MEKEKFDLQKRHTENIQELLEDTNVRLNKMEGEYMAQTQSTVSHFFPFFAIFRNYLLTLHVPMLPWCVQCINKYYGIQRKQFTFLLDADLCVTMDSPLKFVVGFYSELFDATFFFNNSEAFTNLPSFFIDFQSRDNFFSFFLFFKNSF